MRGPRLDFRLRLFHRLQARLRRGLGVPKGHRRRLLLAEGNSFGTRTLVRNRRAMTGTRWEKKLNGARGEFWPMYPRRPWPHRSLRFEGKARRPILYL